jgi:hypothetical protein
MRMLTKKAKMAIPAAIGAGIVALISVPAANAGFNVSLSAPTSGTAVNAQGTSIPVQIYTVSAVNTGGGTGSRLIGYDATVTTSGSGTTGALVIDLSDDTDGDGLLDANVLGQADMNPNGNLQPTPSFGSSLGTFMSIATAAGGTTANATFPGAVTGVWINQFTTTGNGSTAADGLGNGSGTNGETSDYQTGNGTLDAAYTSGTVHSLEVDAAFTNAKSAPLDSSSTGVDFASIVVPTGTSFNVLGAVGGESGLHVAFSVNGGTVTSTGAKLTLTSTEGAGTNVGVLTVTGSNGSYAPQKLNGSPATAITGAAATTGNVQVLGFSPSTDAEVFALAVDSSGTLATGSALTAALSDLSSAVAAEGGTVQALTSSATPNISGIFNPAAWNVEVTFPIGVPAGDPYLNWDFSSDTVDPGLTITDVGVVPEPTGLGVLALGGMGLLARRRRMIQA